MATDFSLGSSGGTAGKISSRGGCCSTGTGCQRWWMSVLGNFLDAATWSHSWPALALVTVLLSVGGWTTDLHRSLRTSISVIILMENAVSGSTENISDLIFAENGCKESLTKCAKLRSSWNKWQLCVVHHLAQKDMACCWRRYYNPVSQEGYRESQAWHMWAFLLLDQWFAQATRLTLWKYQLLALFDSSLV